jgi:catechol 2,3-dioxygenase-like lactoylglutathione lyase family enzyme
LKQDEWLARYQHSQLSRSADQSQPAAYLGIHSIMLYVRNIDASLEFYVEKLGFQIVVDQVLGGGSRWTAVAPPDGSVLLALQPLKENSSNTGAGSVVSLETDDIAGRYQQWSSMGVRFRTPPTEFPWGTLATFLDIDGNELALIQGPWITNLLSSHRESMEQRREAERRSAHEMEIARQVQAGLFPQRRPALETVEYAGACTQARQVGGDYYDFLDLGPGRLAMVVGDISGKGIGGALLMANLQASVRSQYAMALEDIPRLLASVNRGLCDNTPETNYATLIHLPGLLLHRDGTVDRLESTATVLGLFCSWTCGVGEIDVAPGDILALYSDGVTEAVSDDGLEFGEEGLLEALRAEQSAPVGDLVERTIERVRLFSGSEQEDDVTLVVARFD